MTRKIDPPKAKGPEELTATLTGGVVARVGDRVLKITGEYNIEGIIVAIFLKADGETKRLVVEHEAKPKGTFLHIYGPNNLEKLAPADSPAAAPAGLPPIGTRVSTPAGMATVEEHLKPDELGNPMLKVRRQLCGTFFCFQPGQVAPI